MRAVDKSKTVRTRPMQVLCLGLSRTGTSSLCEALEKLGYKPFHMLENFKQPGRFFPLWIEALNAKFFGTGEPFGRAEFDKILGEYDAISDVPPILFADEFLELYPDAKVVLTVRDPKKWIDSMQKTIFKAHSWTSWDWIGRFDTRMGGWRKCDTMDWDAFLGEAGRRDYLSNEFREIAMKRLVEHNEHIRKIVPKDRLLEHKPQDGWAPLCEFLGKPVPKEDYPHAFDSDNFLMVANLFWFIAFGKMIAQTLLPVAAAAGAYYVHKNRLLW